MTALCYYAYAWYLAFTDEEIGQFKFEKHNIGPIEKSIKKIFGLNNNKLPMLNEPELNDAIQIFLNVIWENYGKYSGEELLDRAKYQDPYLKAKNNILQPKDIKKYFKRAF